MIPPDQSSEAMEVLFRSYNDLARPAIERYLSANEHRPYLGAFLSDYPRRGGKMMRPSLCLATAEAFGGPIENAVPTAVAIELFHNASLIHDDIEDDSEERRGRPTLHRLHGIPLAMNTGDSLSLLSLSPLKDNVALLGRQTAFALFEETERTAWELAEGQALDIGWRQFNDMTVDDRAYLNMVLKKTCWLGVIHPCRAGAIVARGRSLSPDSFVVFGLMFGAAFQIQDDILNLMGSAEYGKEENGDLWEGKRTLIVCHAYRSATSTARARFEKILASPRSAKREADIRWLRGQIDVSGSVEFARDFARALAGAALIEFESAYASCPEGTAKSFIRRLVIWAIERTR
jgi:geranylgeranyl diphosphate synthase type II